MGSSKSCRWRDRVTELQQNRYDKLLRRVGGLIGAKSMVNDALGELFPTLDVENVPGELLRLQGTFLGMCRSLNQPVIGDTNHHQLFNPADSQNLVVVTSVYPQSNTAQYMRAAVVNAALTNDVGNVVRRDTRDGVTARLVAENRAVQQPGGIASHLAWRVLANEQYQLTDPNGLWILFPGTGITIATESTNVQSSVSWFWRERPFQPSEDQFSG